ncbi:MAG: hypothetical protein LUF04_10395 [Bacteroides sp.]|nr:hypothetical protein [Bacteroides sp.]
MSTQISVADTALTYTLTLSVQDVLSPALKTATQVSNQTLTVFDKLEKKAQPYRKVCALLPIRPTSSRINWMF